MPPPTDDLTLTTLGFTAPGQMAAAVSPSVSPIDSPRIAAAGNGSNGGNDGNGGNGGGGGGYADARDEGAVSDPRRSLYTASLKRREQELARRRARFPYDNRSERERSLFGKKSAQRAAGGGGQLPGPTAAPDMRISGSLPRKSLICVAPSPIKPRPLVLGEARAPLPGLR